VNAPPENAPGTAALLHAGRLDPALATMARAPRAHPEVAAKVTELAMRCDELYRDLVAALAAEGEGRRGLPS
jgi:hypothetical protein